MASATRSITGQTLTGPARPGMLWPPQRIAPPALPYGAHSACFDFCHGPDPCTLRYFPPPCICTTTGPTTPWAGDVSGQAAH